MKKYLLSLLAAASLTAYAAPAQAELTVIDNWVCHLKGNISGIRLGFGIGGQYLDGHGVIACAQANNPRVRVSKPVELTVVGGGVGFDFTVVKSVKLISAGIGRVGGPDSFLGQYKIAASTGANLIKWGIEANAAVKVTDDYGFGFELGFQGERAYGLGARLHGLVLIIDGEEDAVYTDESHDHDGHPEYQGPGYQGK
jgi:hypothetical protein